MAIAAASRGFSLAEVAIVLVIVVILTAMLAEPVAAQIQQRRVGETQARLEEIRNALYGFAIANGRLPRPATSSVDGTENPLACANDAACTGFVPWVALGAERLDGWGNLVRYSVTPSFANAPFGIATPGSKNLRSTASAGNDVATQVPAVIWSTGAQNFGVNQYGMLSPNMSTTNADEVFNNAAVTVFVVRTAANSSAAPGGEYDDIVTWIPPGVLVAKLIAAARLP